MNAQIGKDENKFYLYNLPYKNYKYLTDFLLENNISHLNIKLKKRKKNM